MHNQNPITEMLGTLAESLPVPAVVNLIKKAIQNYEAEPTDFNLKAVETYCFMFITKQVAATKKGGVQQMFKEAEQVGNLLTITRNAKSNHN